MQTLNSFTEVLKSQEYHRLYELLKAEVPIEVIEMVSLIPREYPELPNALSILPEDIKYLISKYKTDGVSILNIKLFDIASIEEQIINGSNNIAIGSDNLGNYYAFSAREGFFGCASFGETDRDLTRVSSDFYKYAQVCDRYAWDEIPQISINELSDICDYPGVDLNNKF